MKMKPPVSPKTEVASKTMIIVTAPNYRDILVTILGTAPFVSNNFAREAIEQMKIAMELGDQGKSARGSPEAQGFRGWLPWIDACVH